MSQVESRRKRIIAAFNDRLEAITTTDGAYRTDAGASLFVGFVPTVGEETGEAPAVLALVVGDDAPSKKGGKTFIQLPIVIHCLSFGPVDSAWESVEDLLADVKEAVELEDWSLDGLVIDRIERGTTRTKEREPGSTAVGAEIEYTMTYAEAWGSPGA